MSCLRHQSSSREHAGENKAGAGRPLEVRRDLDVGLCDTYNIHVNTLRFVWDKRKNRTNIKKHKVSFEEAETVFKDENAIQYFDPDHSDDEDRFILLGLSARLRVLVVCHCFRESELVIRIISARRADKSECRAYRETKR